MECKDGADGAYTGTTPTKASTAQYTYTFAGWSRTIGGAVDPDAMKNVTADRSLYAVFTATVRTYTVTWYNGSTLLETDSNVPYGTVPTYNGADPVDETNGYPWIGWTPSVGAITGDTTYAAAFEDPVQVVEITDSWETIFANIDNGTYSSVYKVGNYKPLDLGSEGVVNMQIAAFDADDLADGNGKAPVTFIAKELLTTSKRMNPEREGSSGAYTEGTGTIGGWEKSELRAYLKNTIKPLIDENVASRIVPVTKTQPARDQTNTTFTQTTEEDVWIPSYDELGDDGVYTILFGDNDSRIKYKAGATTVGRWWMRSVSGGVRFDCVGEDGGWLSVMNYEESNVALSFCLGRSTN